MMQGTENITDEVTGLAAHLQDLNVADRKIWIAGIKNNLEKGDMKLIEGLTGHKYYQVRQVFQGHTYNPSFAPEIVEIALNIIKARESAKEEINKKVDQFFHDFLVIK